MRFFVTDAILFLLSLLAILLAVIYPGLNNYALALIGAGVIVILYKKTGEACSDFEKSVAGIEGLGWKPVFFSTGTLELEYAGTKMYYSSTVKGERDDALPVDYRISTSSGKDAFLEVLGSDKPGEPEVKGDKKLYSRIKKPVTEFDAKYGLGYLQNKDGLLEFSVIIGFSKEPYPKDAKLADMTAFLRDYVSLVDSVRKSL